MDLDEFETNRAAQADLHSLKLGQEVESALLLLVFWCKTTKVVEGAGLGVLGQPSGDHNCGSFGRHRFGMPRPELKSHLVEEEVPEHPYYRQRNYLIKEWVLARMTSEDGA